MDQRRVGQHDADTGEVLEGSLLAVVIRRAPSGFERGFYVGGLEAARVLATRRHELGMEGYAVLWALIARLDYENLIVVNQTEIAAELDMKRSNVGRAIARLVRADIIEIGPKLGAQRSYRLNPGVTWRGAGAKHQSALRAWEEKRKGFRVLAGGKDADGPDGPKSDT